MVNKVFLVGNLGHDPSSNGSNDVVTIASFSVATSEKWKDKQDEWVEKTEWHNVKAFGGLAKTCLEYLSKGQKVFVEGKLQTREWEDKEGNKRKTTEVVASSVKFLTPRSESSVGAPAGEPAQWEDQALDI